MKELGGEVRRIECVYRTPREACTACKRFYEPTDSDKPLYLLPYNFRLPDQCPWWLSPSSENPAYRHGKFAFSPLERGEMFVGLYIEKGLGKDYCAISSAKSAQKQVMDSTWTWHSVVKDLNTGKLLSALRTIGERAAIVPEIRIEGGYASADFEPERPRYNWDNFTFSLDVQKEVLTSEEARHDGAVLGQLETCRTLKSLGFELSKFTNNPFLWIDLILGVRMRLKGGAEDAWDAGQIVENILEPLEQWVK